MLRDRWGNERRCRVGREYASGIEERGDDKKDRPREWGVATDRHGCPPARRGRTWCESGDSSKAFGTLNTSSSGVLCDHWTTAPVTLCVTGVSCLFLRLN